MVWRTSFHGRSKFSIRIILHLPTSFGIDFQNLEFPQETCDNEDCHIRDRAPNRYRDTTGDRGLQKLKAFQFAPSLKLTYEPSVVCAIAFILTLCLQLLHSNTKVKINQCTFHHPKRRQRSLVNAADQFLNGQIENSAHSPKSPLRNSGRPSAPNTKAKNLPNSSPVSISP